MFNAIDSTLAKKNLKNRALNWIFCSGLNTQIKFNAYEKSMPTTHAATSESK